MNADTCPICGAPPVPPLCVHVKRLMAVVSGEDPIIGLNAMCRISWVTGRAMPHDRHRCGLPTGHQPPHRCMWCQTELVRVERED